MDAIYFISFLVLFSVGTIFHYIRPRETVLHTLKDTLFDNKVFETEIYLGRIRRIIQKSAGKYGGVSKPIKKETTEKQSSKPPCVGLQDVNGG